MIILVYTTVMLVMEERRDFLSVRTIFTRSKNSVSCGIGFTIRRKDSARSLCDHDRLDRATLTGLPNSSVLADSESSPGLLYEQKLSPGMFDLFEMFHTTPYLKSRRKSYMLIRIDTNILIRR